MEEKKAASAALQQKRQRENEDGAIEIVEEGDLQEDEGEAELVINRDGKMVVENAENLENGANPDEGLVPA